MESGQSLLVAMARSSTQPEVAEETVYVVLDLQDLDSMPPPGSRLQLQGMETQQPVLQLADGTRLVGAFEESVGTQLVLGDAVTGDGSHRVQLVCHTDKRICFSKVPVSAGPTAAEVGAAAAPAGAAEGRAAEGPPS